MNIGDKVEITKGKHVGSIVKIEFKDTTHAPTLYDVVTEDGTELLHYEGELKPLSPLNKIKDLIIEHNLTIHLTADDCSDWSGIYGDQMIISDDDGNELVVDGCSIDRSDF